MSGYACPHCGETIDLFGTGGGEQTAKQFGLKFLGRIPFDPNMVKAGDAGEAYQQLHADSPVTKAFSNIVDEIGKLV